MRTLPHSCFPFFLHIHWGAYARDLPPSPVFPLETYLIWINPWPLSFPGTCLRYVQFLLSLGAVPPLASIMPWECLVAQAALGHKWPWQGSQLHSFFQLEECLCSRLCILPNHTICIISSSSRTSEVTEKSWVSVDSPPYFFLHCHICSLSNNLTHTHGLYPAVWHWVIPISE